MAPNTEALMKDINDRLTAIGESVSEQRIQQIVQDYLNNLNDDDPVVRKMRFGKNGGGDDKKLIGTKFARWGLGISDVEFLYDVLESAQRIGLSSGPSEELRNTFDALSEALYVPMDEVRAIDRQAIDNLFPRIPLSWFYGSDRALAAKGAFELTNAYKDAIRAMDTAESGYGSQLIGAQYVGELWEAARRESRIFSLIDTFEMTAPTAYLPVEVDIPEMLYVSENTASDSSNYDTVKTGSQRVSVSAKKYVIHQMWSGEMEEDSIIPFVPFLRRQGLLSLAHYSDSVVMNGDTTNAGTGNINLDDADPDDTKHYLAFDGIRKVGLADNTDNQEDIGNVAITFENLRDAKGRMMDTDNLVDWGHPTQMDDLVYVSDPETADHVATLDEVIWWRMYNASQALLNGEVARIIGHPFIGSMAVSKTEADGKVSDTADNNDRGQVVPFNRRAFKVGWRRRVKLETERLPARDQTRLVYSLRMGFGRFTPTGAASGIEAADCLFNIAL